MNPLLIRRRGMMQAQGGGAMVEIEYLESTGLQVIDSGISRPSSYLVEFEQDVQFMDLTGRQIAGAVNQFYIGVNNSRWETTYNSYHGTADTNRHLFTKKITAAGPNLRYEVFLDGVSIYYTTRPKQPSDFQGNLYLFGIGPTYQSIAYKARLYGETIHTNGNLVRDFIPVRVGQVGYMYDRVSGQLFGNAGTGAFILGPDVQ